MSALSPNAISTAPSIVFDPTKATIVDAGLNNEPAIFQYDAATGSLTQTGTDVQAEMAALITAPDPAKVRLSVEPLWFQPSRARFWLTGQMGQQRGAGKEYASLTIGVSQIAALPELQGQPLSWSFAWSLITNGTQDVPSASLLGATLSPSNSSKNTFMRMPIVDGQAVLGVEFTTGVADDNVQKSVNELLNPLQHVAGSQDIISGLSIPATSVTTAIQYMSAIGDLLSTVGAGHPKISIDLKSGNTRAVVDASAFDPADPVALRLPAGNATFFFVPETSDKGLFLQTLAAMKQHQHRVQIDGQGVVSVVDPNAVPVTATPYALKPAWQTLAPLDPFTIVALQTYVEVLP